MSGPTNAPPRTAQSPVFGVTFETPVLLAAGTCGFGEPVVDVMAVDRIGGLVTKSVTLEPRAGNPAPRVTEYALGMLNSVGLANPGLEAVRKEKLPWMREHLADLPVFVSVAGHNVGEFAAVVEGLAGEDGFLGFELNLSCPNDDRLGGQLFALDRAAIRLILSRVRPLTDRPLVVKLAPQDPAIEEAAVAAVEEGADGITAVNTLPGFLADHEGRPRLGAGAGGASGPALLPIGLAAVRRIAAAVDVPIMGVGGILTAGDAIQYLRAGATLVQIGTASFADPRCAARVARGVRRHLFP